MYAIRSYYEKTTSASLNHTFDMLVGLGFFIVKTFILLKYLANSKIYFFTYRYNTTSKLFVLQGSNSFLNRYLKF